MDLSPLICPPNRLREERMRRHLRQRDVADRLGTTVVTLRRWERGTQQPSAYFRLKLCAFFGKSAEELGLLQASPLPPPIPQMEPLVAVPISSSEAEVLALWTVPSARNPYFTGRDDLLERLDHQLSPQRLDAPPTTRRVALTQAQAIKGLGGIGKTQIAVEYAYRSCDQGRYSYILWIDAANEETLISSFGTLAELLPAFAAKNEPDQYKLVAAIKRWLEECQQPWLLILDNVEDISLVQEYCPHQGNGSLLFTTRMHATGSLASSIEVETMGVIEGALLLLHRAQRQNASDEETNEATNMVIALDGFPLALDQAGAYIEETGCSFRDYLQLYQAHRQTLLARRGIQTTNYPESVATTWSLSFQRIAQANPAAAELLQLCAFLAPDHIPEELLTEAAEQWPPLLHQATADRFAFHRMLEEVLRFSLVKRLTDQRMLSLHRLVQAVQMDAMSQEEQRHWAQRVVRAVNILFPRAEKEEIASWPLCLRYLEQVQVCDTLIQEYQLLLPEAADLLDRTGAYLRDRGLYTPAEPLYQRTLHIREQVLGPDHPDVVTSLTYLALLYYDQGKYAQAEPLFRRALSIREQTLGPGHPDVAQTLNGLANLYGDQGKYAEAEPLHQRALAIREQTLGSDHPDVAQTLSNLGQLSIEQGKYEQGILPLQRALAIREQTLGSDHPRTAFPLTSLAVLYTKQGKYVQAEPLFRRALSIREQTLGPEHPHVAYVLSELAILYSEQGKYERAEPLFRQALHIWEQMLGLQCPDSAPTLNGLADLYTQQGNYEQAEPFYQRVLHIGEQVLGTGHPEVAHSLTGLANLSREQGKYERAEALYQRALRIWEQQLGPEHPETAKIMHEIAQLREAQGECEEARSWYTRALAVREQALGADHPKTAETRRRFATLLRTMGCGEGAAPPVEHNKRG